jgi:hypothetical protein
MNNKEVIKFLNEKAEAFNQPFLFPMTLFLFLIFFQRNRILKLPDSLLPSLPGAIVLPSSTNQRK